MNFASNRKTHYRSTAIALVWVAGSIAAFAEQSQQPAAPTIASVMEAEYELFERRTDGVLSWRGVVQGLAAARIRTRLLAIETDHECFARSADREPSTTRWPAAATRLPRMKSSA